MLGDDGVVVRERHSGSFEALETYPGLRLLPASLAFLYGDDPPGRRVAAYTDKRRVPGEKPREPSALPLRASSYWVIR